MLRLFIIVIWYGVLGVVGNWSKWEVLEIGKGFGSKIFNKCRKRGFVEINECIL